jgi:hypothetical protein
MLIKTKRWARLRPASKSIYPVIAVHCDKTGLAFPSQETIAILAGTTVKTVREGVQGLLDLSGFSVDSKVNSRGHRQKLYKLTICPDEVGRSFALFKSVFEGGNWSQLLPSAHAIYPVVKTFSFFDCGEYDWREESDYGTDCRAMIEDGVFVQRKYDFFNADHDVLAEYAGIGHRTTYDALASLEKHHLIERTDNVDGCVTWKVFRAPPKYYKRDWLNGKIANRYGRSDLPN